MAQSKDETKDAPLSLEDEAEVKLILLGDSAVGKTKMVERFLMDEYNPQQLSTYALTLFRKKVDLNGRDVTVGESTSRRTPASAADIWDTAGQERFNKMHPAYYYRAHACILCFDVTRKATYQHLANWFVFHSSPGSTIPRPRRYDELRESCESIPCLLVANKIDIDYQVRLLSVWPPHISDAGHPQKLQIRLLQEPPLLFRFRCRRHQCRQGLPCRHRGCPRLEGKRRRLPGGRSEIGRGRLAPR